MGVEWSEELSSAKLCSGAPWAPRCGRRCREPAGAETPPLAGPTGAELDVGSVPPAPGGSLLSESRLWDTFRGVRILDFVSTDQSTSYLLTCVFIRLLENLKCVVDRCLYVALLSNKRWILTACSAPAAHRRRSGPARAPTTRRCPPRGPPPSTPRPAGTSPTRLTHTHYILPTNNTFQKWPLEL